MCLKFTHGARKGARGDRRGDARMGKPSGHFPVGLWSALPTNGSRALRGFAVWGTHVLADAGSYCSDLGLDRHGLNTRKCPHAKGDISAHLRTFVK